MTVANITYRDEAFECPPKVCCPTCSESRALIQEDLVAFRCKACGTKFNVDALVK